MKKNAFTLIELLVVISIISLISSITFAGVQEGKEKAQDAKMKSEVTQVSRAVQQYKFDLAQVPGKGVVTPNVELIEGSDGEYAGEYELAMQELVDQGYLSGIPQAPGEHVYTYLISDDGDQAVFGADLNNENEGGGSGNNRNSCSLTEALGGGGTPPCTEPDYPPDPIDLYGYSWYFSLQIPGDGNGSYPMNLIGGCTQTYPDTYSGDLRDYWIDNGYTCVDKTQTNFNALCTCSENNYVPTDPDATPSELCQNWGNSNCGGISSTAPGYFSFIYDPSQFAQIRNYLEQYDEPYAQAYAEYEQCVLDDIANNPDDYDENDDWIGGGDEPICSGAVNTDYCMCL